MIFSKDSLWNKPAEQADDKPSDAIINSCSNPADWKPIPFGLSLNDYSVPIFRKEELLPSSWFSPWHTVCVDHPEWGAPSVVRLRMPTSARPATGTDHHLCIIDGDAVHDFWNMRQARRYDWNCGFYRKWDLKGSGTAPVWTAGCRASGAPLLAGLVTRNEMIGGEINHALALAVPFIKQSEDATPAIIAPASATQKGEQGDYLAMGQRIMLDPAYDVPMWVPEEVEILAKVLKTYGAIVVDVSLNPVFYLEDLEHSPNKWWFNNSILSALPLESLRIAK